QTLRVCRTVSSRAKRLDCVRFTAAIVRQLHQSTRKTTETFITAAASGLSIMNFKPVVFATLTLGFAAQTFATVIGT
ncbi:MAG TPA: hypothetical protein DCQ92_00775, partial [Verrucomicrobia subdivision 3 bacterium]|nr:hypothetical protein [Limisphaerales bacterium]